jgi:iron complex transport system ATP-binding protein
VTILLVSHDLNLAAELCDRLLLLHEGRVARVGTPGEVLEQAALEHVFGCRVMVDRSPSGRPTVQLAWSTVRAEATTRPPTAMNKRTQ